MLTPGRFDPCQLAWQVNQLNSQKNAQEEPRLASASAGPWALSRALPASGLGVLAALADKLLAPARRAGRGPGVNI